MDGKAFDDYRRDRYEEQRNWYDRKSAENRRWDRITSVSVLVLATVVPLVILVADDDSQWVKVVGAVLSALIAMVTGVARTFRFHDLYIQYRSNAEALKREIHYYNAGIGPYSGVAEREPVFVSRVELLISRENALWQEKTSPESGDASRESQPTGAADESKPSSIAA